MAILRIREIFERHAFVHSKSVDQKERKQQQNPIPSESEELPSKEMVHLGLEDFVWVINTLKTLKTLDLAMAFC